MQGAKIIDWSRHLQLIPWLTYSALKSQVCAFSSVKLPRTGMLGLSVIKQDLPYSGGHSTCVFPLQMGKAGGLFHSGGIWERLSSLHTGFYAWRGSIWAKHAWHHFGSFHGGVMFWAVGFSRCVTEYFWFTNPSQWLLQKLTLCPSKNCKNQFLSPDGHVRCRYYLTEEHILSWCPPCLF